MLKMFVVVQNFIEIWKSDTFFLVGDSNVFIQHSSSITLEWDEITNVVVLKVKVTLKQAVADWLRSGER